MKRNISILSLLLSFLLIGCIENHNKNIDRAYQLLETNPDNALTILDGVNQHRLADNEKARYALVYTIAQDKSGLDVDDDSLLSIAYAYYKDREEDTLYAKCMYYMGLYYALNSKSEYAIVCYKNSIEASDKKGDKYTECMALHNISVELRRTAPQKASQVAREAVDIYSSLDNCSQINLFYYKLNLATTLAFADSLYEAEKECNNAIKIAKSIHNTELLSFAYQDMAEILRGKKEYTEALEYALLSHQYIQNGDNSKYLNLAQSYLDVDSIEACERIISNITPQKTIETYTLLHIKHLVATRKASYVEASKYADSTYACIENMYTEQLSQKEQYYKDYAEAQYEKGIIEGRVSFHKNLMATIIVFCIAVISLLLYSYRQYKRRTLVQAQKEKAERDIQERLLEEEVKQKELQLKLYQAEAEKELEKRKLKEDMERRIIEKNMQYKELQLATMRKYILSKIRIAQKIEELKGNYYCPLNHSTLSPTH